MNDRIEVLKEIISKVLPYLFKDGEEVEQPEEGSKHTIEPGMLRGCLEDEEEDVAPEMPTKKHFPKIVKLSMSSLVPKEQEGKQSIVSELLGKKPQKRG